MKDLSKAYLGVHGAAVLGWTIKDCRMWLRRGDSPVSAQLRAYVPFDWQAVVWAQEENPRPPSSTQGLALGLAYHSRTKHWGPRPGSKAKKVLLGEMH